MKAAAQSRRTFLHRAGGAMALPWLVSQRAAGPFPKRFAVLFMGNGVNGNHWWAKGRGVEMQLGKTLQPLAPLKTKINVIHGLFNPPAMGRGIHPAQTGNLLSCVPLQPGASLRGGVSVDQALARRLQRETPLASLVLSCEPPKAGGHETGYALAYSSHISWDRPESPVAPEWCASGALDRIALAFQTDTTRIATLTLASDLSELRYPFLGVPETHHEASHYDLSEGYERICRFHVRQFAYLAARLDAMPEGDGTVLDNSCLLFLSNMWSGWKHDNMKLPVVLAGGLGGTLETGRSLDYLNAGDENRKLASLYLTIMDRMGVKLERFGDAETRLAGL
jgi:hypothetical protein